MNSDPVLVDESALTRLHALGGASLVRDLIGTFLKNAPQRIEDARNGLAAGNLEVVMRAGHSLKSSCANTGATVMREIASRIEEAAMANRCDTLADDVRHLSDAFDTVRPLLEARRQAAFVRPCVAVIEDNPDNRLLVRAMLEDRYDIEEYETGPQALDAFHRRRPCLVLLDISLPGMDGIQVLEEIRADEGLRSLPVVALTAHAMAGDKAKFLAAGFDAYVAKPIVDEQVLLAAIDRLLMR
jgi:two-component system cell cycle response regulator DivK